jgi:molecular chaperone GrpE
MTTKKNQKQNEVAQVDEDKKEKSTNKKNEEEIEKLKQQLKEKDDQLLRSLADYQNYQNRVKKDMDLHEFEIKKTYLSELLDIKELLLKALDDIDPKEGLRIILKQLENFFHEEHINYIECVGKPFNHALHHAVTTIENEDKEDNIIIEEIKKGYLINDAVLRPSHVVVVKNKCEEE